MVVLRCFLPTNYFYTSIYQPASPPTTTPVPAIIPTPPPSAFPSLAPASGSSPGYTIDKYQIVATDPMLQSCVGAGCSPGVPDPYPTVGGGALAPVPSGYGPGSSQN